MPSMSRNRTEDGSPADSSSRLTSRTGASARPIRSAHAGGHRVRQHVVDRRLAGHPHRDASRVGGIGGDDGAALLGQLAFVVVEGDRIHTDRGPVVEHGRHAGQPPKFTGPVQDNEDGWPGSLPHPALCGGGGDPALDLRGQFGDPSTRGLEVGSDQGDAGLPAGRPQMRQPAHPAPLLLRGGGVPRSGEHDDRQLLRAVQYRRLTDQPASQRRAQFLWPRDTRPLRGWPAAAQRGRSRRSFPRRRR